MIIGDGLGALGRSGVQMASDCAHGVAHFVDTTLGHAFTDPESLKRDLKLGFDFALNNKVYELAGSVVVVLGAAITGVALARKAYRLDLKENATKMDKALFVAKKVALYGAALALISLSGYELYSRMSETRWMGTKIIECGALKERCSQNFQNDFYEKQMYEAYYGAGCRPFLGKCPPMKYGSRWRELAALSE